MSVQPAKPASPIRLLCEQLPNIYVFFAHEIFTTFCALFPNRISHLKILAVLSVYVMVYVFCLFLSQKVQTRLNAVSEDINKLLLIKATLRQLKLIGLSYEQFFI